ncbi:EpsG family protein [Halanaerobium congolense]|uniref:EpsG family protein n=1 Tax=Halanaerobium congolense TaxID=54121 RepID=UPI001AAC6930|nr:EpsG family protein [Halanaerobium congolense]
MNNLNNNPTLNYNPFYFTLLFISTVLGFRYDVGTDFMSYIHFFERYKFGINPPDLEFGYELINKLTIYLGLDSWFVFFISAFLINFLILKTIKNNSNNFLLSVIILFGTGFIFLQINIIRQSIAIAFTFYGAKYIVSRDFKKYILFCVLGMMFHFTAFIMIPFYWIANIKWNKTILLLGLFLSLILFLQPNILNVIVKKFLEMFTIPEYEYYIKIIFEKSGGVNSGYRVIFEGLFAFIFILLTPKEMYKYIKGKIYFNFFALSYMSNMLFGRFYVVSRVTLYFSIFQTLFFPYFIYNIPANKKNKALLATLTMIYFSFWTVWAINGNSHDILPYKFVFNR